MKKHIHFFKHTGGGTMLVGEGLPCDDSYHCDCGEVIIIRSSPDGQSQLPKTIKGEVQDSDLDQAYQEAIIKNLPN